MQRTELVSLYKATPADGSKVTVCGWAKTVRDSKNIGFISLSDGSCYKPVQIVFQADKLANYAEIAKCGLYTSFEVTGTLVVTPGAKQPFEINADEITVRGMSLRSRVVTWNISPAPSQSEPVKIGVCT